MLATAAVVFPSIVAAQPEPTSDSAATAISRGDSLLRAFDTRAAIDAYREGLSGGGENAELLRKTSRAIGNLAEETPGRDGDEEAYREAVELARRAVNASPDTARTHATLAAALGRLALYEGGRRKVELAREVELEARRAVELDPSDFAAFIVLGVLNRELATLNPFLKAFARTFFGRLPEASLERSAAHLERAVKLAPQITAARYELALTYLELDRESAAIEAMRTVLTMEPQERLDQVLQERAAALARELES